MAHKSHVHYIRGGGKIRAVPRLQTISIHANLDNHDIIQQQQHRYLYQNFRSDRVQVRCQLPILPKLLRLMRLLVCEFFVALSVCSSMALIWSDLAVVSEAHSPATADPIVDEHAPEAPQTSAKPLQTSDAEAIPTSEEGPVEDSKSQEVETNLETASISGKSEVSSNPALSVSMPESQNAIVTLVEPSSALTNTS